MAPVIASGLIASFLAAAIRQHHGVSASSIVALLVLNVTGALSTRRRRRPGDGRTDGLRTRLPGSLLRVSMCLADPEKSTYKENKEKVPELQPA